VTAAWLPQRSGSDAIKTDAALWFLVLVLVLVLLVLLIYLCLWRDV
jgi:hypothetical protein